MCHESSGTGLTEVIGSGKGTVRLSDFDYADALRYVYGMTVDEWKRDFQTPASEEQMQKYEESKPLHAKISGY